MNDFVRFPHLIRLLVVFALDKNSGFADKADKALSALTDEELKTLIYGELHEMRDIIKKHKIPNSVLDLIGILIDGSSTSSFILHPTVEDPPPKKVMH